MVWVDPLVLPYVAATGAVLVGFCRRELWGAAGALLGAAAVLGAAPLLLHSLLTGRNPLHAVLAASGANASAGWPDRLHGGLVLGPGAGHGLLRSRAVRHLATVVGARPAAAAGPRRRHRLASPAHPRHPDRPAGSCRWVGSDAVSPRVAAAVRLALVLAAVATLGAYTVSSSAGLTPVESSRYLSCLLISLPALLWPVWTTARTGCDQRRPAGAASGRRWPARSRWRCSWPPWAPPATPPGRRRGPPPRPGPPRPGTPSW